MKIVLHGATDYGSSNYGDFLYGRLIYDFLKDRYPESDVVFYNPSDYFVKYINSGYKSLLRGNIGSATRAVYIPGGYFGEGHDASWKETAVQFKRFIPFGIKAVIRNKPYAIIGVGAGPNNNYFFKNAVRYVVKHASTVCVRDKESFEALESLGCNNILCYADPLLAFNIEGYDSIKSEQCKQIEEITKDKNNKIILIHFNHSKLAALKFGKALKEFIGEHPDYYPVVSADQCFNNYQELLDIFETEYQSQKYFYFHYDDPFEFGKLVSMVDFVLTCKLHVGVTAAMKGKALLAAAVHPEKTSRFYKQINATEHFLNLYDSSSKDIAQKMSELGDRKIVIPQDVIDLAKENLKKLENFIANEIQI